MIKLILESIAFAFGSLKSDKFRTFLSLFGVSIGIFSIVMVFTAIDALGKNVNRGLSTLNSSSVFIQQFPWGPEEGESEYKWWEYLSRPQPKYREFLFLREKLTTAKATSFAAFTNKNVKYKRSSFNNASIISPAEDWDKVTSVEIEKGRYFSPYELESAVAVAIIGNSVAENLFLGGEDPLNKIIKIGGERLRVIGVNKKAGESIVNIFDTDNSVTIPYSYAEKLFNVNNSGTIICTMPADEVDRATFLQEIKQLMRAVRRIKPTKNDNFAINEMTFMLTQVESIFSGINLAGWIIGGFSILIGGFGIANIMFVSVKERTNLIGIQKALGAKKYTILIQFLAEAAALALLGGLIGLLIVFGVIAAVGNTGSFPMELSVYNIIRGLLIASIIGIVSGFVPAYTASNLNPVDAINSK